jgi:hypothetical protein
VNGRIGEKQAIIGSHLKNLLESYRITAASRLPEERKGQKANFR